MLIVGVSSQVAWPFFFLFVFVIVWGGGERCVVRGEEEGSEEVGGGEG